VASRYDARMLEIAAQRESERAAQAGSTVQDRISESTETINRGMADPVNWLLFCGGIVLIPITGALSIGLIIWGLLRMTAGGRACAQAIAPTAADLAAPGPGCVRILAALGVTVLTIIVILMFFALIAYHLGVQP